MEWQTPADKHWANNYAVTCQARIANGKATMTYTATHLPTMHQETDPLRGNAITKLQRWLAGQQAPTEPTSEGHPYGSEARRQAMMEAQRNAILSRQ